MIQKTTNTKRAVLLMVDDDKEDVYLTKRAFCAQNTNLIFNGVPDCQSLFDYLNRRGDYAELPVGELPQVILLDINIPKENGFEILTKLRNDAEHAHIPVTMLTTSAAEHDVRKAYRLGASSFITKSASAKGMKIIADQFCNYWFDLACIPTTD